MEQGSGLAQAAAQKQIVLVIDGKVMRQFYTSIYLQRMNYHVIMARTAEDALLFLELTVPLAVIANYDLPAMSGLELLKHIRQEERTRRVPVIIYTSNRDPSVRQACEDAGCAGFLRHPCSLDDLYRTVQSATEVRPRRFVRLATRIEVAIDEGGEGRLDYIVAISELGMFVSSAAPLPYGSVHRFTFHLPNAPGWVFRIEGQVLYQHLGSESRKQPGMGVKFLKITEQERELVRDFIRREHGKGLVQD